MKPKFFKTPEDFRKWLIQHHETEPELLVGFYKKATGKQSITWPESVDQALCFGWIDGVRKSGDEESYHLRFTPRRANSIWSAVNIGKMEKLLKEGLVYPMGKAAYAKRTEEKSRVYAFEQKEDAVLPPEMEKRFKKEKAAYEFFQKQAPSYRKVVLHGIVSAKKDETKESRFVKLLEASKAGKRL
ncbi:MAG: YdeI/OmpD-associated family protein [Flavobacterium sp.]